MFSEYDVVRLRSASKAPGVPVGARGTILIVYPNTPPAYEVEFVDEADRSLGTFTMPESDLQMEWKGASRETGRFVKHRVQLLASAAETAFHRRPPNHRQNRRLAQR